jgi:hypothetical protein
LSRISSEVGVILSPQKDSNESCVRRKVLGETWAYLYTNHRGEIS